MSKLHATKPPVPAIVNRRARFDYELSDDIVVGMNLTGLEVRAAREGHVQLKGAYVTIRNSELWLNNASFSLRHNEQGQPNARTVSTSARKLLAKRRQIEQLAAHGTLNVNAKMNASASGAEICAAMSSPMLDATNAEPVTAPTNAKPSNAAMWSESSDEQCGSIASRILREPRLGF